MEEQKVPVEMVNDKNFVVSGVGETPAEPEQIPLFPPEEPDLEAIRRGYEAMLAKLVPPHTKISRPVTDEDTNKIQEDIQSLYSLCHIPAGKYRGAYAMHHSQINDTDPLSLFVMSNMLIICNPVITRHSNYTKDSKEACVTFNNEDQTIVQRWQKCEVQYQTIMVDPDDESKFRLSGIITDSLSGPAAFVFQHEFSHGNAQYIYEIKKEENA